MKFISCTILAYLMASYSAHEPDSAQSRNMKYYMTILAFLIFFGILGVSTAISYVTTKITINSMGMISVQNVYAASGSAVDIQAAVDQVVLYGGIGNVHIPEGTFNFFEVGEQWSKVEIPAGVNLFGALTERDANGQVVEWLTILQMPFEAPTGSVWFRYTLNNNLGFRFSDVRLVGYRNIDNDSTTMYTGVDAYAPWAITPTEGYLDFRVDHNHFDDLAGSGFSFGGTSNNNRRVYRGLIDHNRFTNTYGDPGYMDYPNRTLGYGLALGRWASDVWDYEITNVIGQYTNYTVFVEDNYFSKWRHCITSNHGIHYVARYNTVESGYGIGEFDAHGSYANGDYPYAVGTRAIEVYENTFKNPDNTWSNSPWAINHRGGGAIMYNNTLIGYDLCHLNNDYGNYEPLCPQSHINDTYIWNNTLNGATLIQYNYDNTEDVNYYLRAPNIGDDGWEWTPYEYPHPMISGESTP